MTIITLNDIENKDNFQKQVEKLQTEQLQIPKEFQWLLQLQRLKDMGLLLKFFYDNNGKIEEYDHLHYFEVDSEGQSFVPVMPTYIKVYKYVSGKGFVEVAHLSGERGFLDPDVDTAMRIWNIASGL
ncbi:MAG: hypothetical protein ACTSV7_00805 [Candidatus Baldrarchaeia archaeon]